MFASVTTQSNTAALLIYVLYMFRRRADGNRSPNHQDSRRKRESIACSPWDGLCCYLMLIIYKFFRQEYPITWEESFLASGRKVFDARALRSQRDRNTKRNPIAEETPMG